MRNVRPSSSKLVTHIEVESGWPIGQVTARRNSAEVRSCVQLRFFQSTLVNHRASVGCISDPLIQLCLAASLSIYTSTCLWRNKSPQQYKAKLYGRISARKQGSVSHLPPGRSHLLWQLHSKELQTFASLIKEHAADGRDKVRRFTTCRFAAPSIKRWKVSESRALTSLGAALTNLSSIQDNPHLVRKWLARSPQKRRLEEPTLLTCQTPGLCKHQA